MGKRSCSALRHCQGLQEFAGLFFLLKTVWQRAVEAYLKNMVALLYFDTMQSVSTFKSEVRKLLCMLEPHSMDSLGHQHCTKKLSPKIVLHFKVLCESKAALPKCTVEH